MANDEDDGDEACSLCYRRAPGIGLSICEYLARAGHRVAVADYTGDGADEAAEAIRDSGG
ncbi:MAG: hypothetical protein ABSB59_01465 [Streptosporangiaceae bacterium]|jgi:NAD(P)-dependent dehydrogenase (short-subunit alcohol dehydrogenase family)